MTTSTLTLTDFLLARIAEDEERESSWERVDRRLRLADNRAHWSRKRRLAECEAKRRIVGRCSAVDYAMPSTHLAHGILAELALAYADHPDFREEWRL